MAEIVITGISITVDTSNVTTAKKGKDCPFFYSHNQCRPRISRRRSRGSTSSQEGTAIAITHIAKERLENLTSRDKTLSRAKNKHCEHSCKKCSTRKSYPEMSIHLQETKSQLSATCRKIKRTLTVRQKSPTEPRSVRYTRNAPEDKYPISERNSAARRQK